MIPILAGIVKFATSTAGGKLLDKVTTGGLINNKHTSEEGFPVGRINWNRFGRQVIVPVVIAIVTAILSAKGISTEAIEALSK